MTFRNNAQYFSIKTFGLSFLLMLLFQVNAFAQDYRKHTVMAGETIYSLSKKYDISKEDILKLNPDAVNGLGIGDLLILPPVKDKNQDSTFVNHTVQAKETLYGLAKQYGISIDDLLEYNPELMHGLEIGMVIKVPKSGQEISWDEKSEVKLPPVEKGYQIITVASKETVYSLCKTYHLTEEEFFRLNPEVKENGLKKDSKIKVPLNFNEAPKENPSNIVIEDIPVDEVIEKVEQPKKKEFTLYQVKVDDTLEKLAFDRGITLEEIRSLNPEILEGLTPGRYIILPKEAVLTVVGPANSNNWLDLPSLQKTELRVTLVLPFYTAINDSLANNGMGEKTKIYSKSKVALEFYNGFILALDTLAALGIDVDLQVIDNQNSLDKMQRIPQKIKAHRSDFVVGPLYAKNVEWLANQLVDIPVISPLTKALENNGNANLIDCFAHFESEVLSMAQEINKRYLNDRVVFVNPDNEVNRKMVGVIRQNLKSMENPDIEEFWVGEKYPTVSDFRFRKATGKRTVWVLNNEDPAFLNDFLTKIYKIKDTNMVILASSKVFDIKTVENRYLNELNFKGFSREYSDFTKIETLDFVHKYQLKTNTYPSEYAFKAYDIGIYFSVISLLNNGLPIQTKWPKYQGIIQGYNFIKEVGKGPVNNHVFLLEVKNYELHNIN